MFQKFGVLAMMPVLIAAAPAYAEWHGNAHIENVEVTGSYLTDDTSTFSIWALPCHSA